MAGWALAPSNSDRSTRRSSGGLKRLLTQAPILYHFQCRIWKCRQSPMFIGVSGNAASLETYWRHKLLTYPLALAGGDSRQNPRNAPMKSGGCHSPRRWADGSQAKPLVERCGASGDGSERPAGWGRHKPTGDAPPVASSKCAADFAAYPHRNRHTGSYLSAILRGSNAASILRTCCNV